MFDFKFIDGDATLHLELMNTTDQILKGIEVLTVFLKDDDTERGPSSARIRFESIESIKPHEKAIIRHRTWGGGKPVSAEDDQLRRLLPVHGKLKPYVLDISWQDVRGKTCFQRIPVGH
jgi:hypothetical protein